MSQIAVITGSSRGIGAEIAKCFGRAGFHALVAYRTQEARAQDVVDTIRGDGGEASSVQVDVRSEASVIAMYEEVRRAHGSLDALVCNAVEDVIKPIDEASLEE